MGDTLENLEFMLFENEGDDPSKAIALDESLRTAGFVVDWDPVGADNRITKDVPTLKVGLSTFLCFRIVSVCMSVCIFCLLSCI